MTSTVIHMTHCVDRDAIARLFAKFANHYGKIWTTRLGEDGDWNACVVDWLEELSRFTLDEVRQGVSVALGIHKDYPPTLGQLIDLCLKASGVPEQSQVIRMMTAKDFSHPVVKMVYDKIGSWKLANGSEKDIAQLTRDHYDTVVHSFQSEPKGCWDKLVEFNAKPKELPPPDKIPTAEERRGFKERMAEYQKIADDAKASITNPRHREFDHSKLKPGSRDFDELLFSEYKAYLLGVPETMTLMLSAKDCHARMRFLNMRDQPEYLKKAGYIPVSEREGCESPKASDRRDGRPTKIYKTWTND